MELEDGPFAPHSTREAIARGVGVVHQERNLIPHFSIAENIFLERLSAKPLQRIDYPALYRDAQKWLDLLEIDASPDTRVERLNVARMQLVEIAKALSLRSRILMLDEPTASLTQHETDTLFAILRRLRDDGASLVFVSHKLEEVQEICDRVTVLRDGRNACESRTMEGLDRQDIVRLMIGRSERIPEWSQRDHSDRAPALELRGVSTADGHRDVTFTLKKGEVLGLYGLVGSGRTELAKAIIGARKITGGEVLVDGKPARIGSVADALHQHGIGYVSEDRKGEGLILIHSVLDNAGITVWQRLRNRLGLVTDAAVTARGRAGHPQARGPHAVAAPDHRQPVGREPAEGQRGEVAGGQRARPDHRRADGGRRHQDQGLCARTDTGIVGRRHVDPAHHQRHARDGHGGRPHPRDG